METTESDDDEDMDQPLTVPEVSSVKGALGLAKQLVEFADWSSLPHRRSQGFVTRSSPTNVC